MPPPWQRQPEQQPETQSSSAPWNQGVNTEQVEQRPNREVSRAAAFLNNFSQGATFGFSDEIAATLQAAAVSPFSEKTFGEVFTEQLALERENIRLSREQHKNLSTAGSLTGAVGTGLGLAKGGLTLTGMGAQTVPRAMGLGAAEGAIYGAAFGAGEGDTLRERAQGALRGAALGGVTGGITGLAGATLARRTRAADSLDDIRAASRAAYATSEQAGLAIRQDAYRRFLGRAEQRLTEEGFRPGVTKKLNAVLREFFSEVGDEPITLRKLDELRKVARRATTADDTAEDHLLYMLIGEVDDFVRNLSAAQTTASLGGEANRRVAIDALRTARQAWARFSKGQALEDAIGRAAVLSDRSARSMDQNLRMQFDAILRNPRRIRGFTQAERDAIEKVVRGGALDNVYRLIGKLDPLQSPFGGIMGAGVGQVVAGPIGAGAVPLAAIGSNRAANVLTGTNARLASELVRRGSPTVIQPSAAVTPTIMALASQPDLTEEQLRGRGNAMVDLLMRR